MIVMTAEEADKVRGRSPKDIGKALDPVPAKDGSFYLGIEVLEDPAHEDVRDFLQSLPVVTIDKLARYESDDLRPVGIQTADLGTRDPVDSKQLSEGAPTRRTP